MRAAAPAAPAPVQVRVPAGVLPVAPVVIQVRTAAVAPVLPVPAGTRWAGTRRAGGRLVAGSSPLRAPPHRSHRACTPSTLGSATAARELLRPRPPARARRA